MKKFISQILFLSLLISCASEKPKGKTEAEILFKEAQSLIKEERYILATEKINNLRNQYPYSYYATPAELLKADILFLQENYVEAAAAYLIFRDFHPRHAKIDYVIFKIAESYYMQIPETDDRDLEPAVEAIKYYQELLVKFPKSTYLKDGKEKIAECKQKLQNKEQYVADFYYRTEVYSAARWRYLEILNSFSDKKLRSHSMQRIVLSTYFMKEYEKCIVYANNYSQDLQEKDKKLVQEYRKYCQKKM